VAKRPFAVGVVLAAACTSMHQVEPKQFIPEHKPTEVSVWTAPDDVVVVTNPRIAGDSLMGDVFEEHWAIALTNVLKVEATAPDGRRTAMFLSAAAATAIGLYLISNSGTNNGMPPCPPTICGQTILPPPP
jgi:hypothetical protein